MGLDFESGICQVSRIVSYLVGANQHCCRFNVPGPWSSLVVGVSRKVVPDSPFITERDADFQSFGSRTFFGIECQPILDAASVGITKRRGGGSLVVIDVLFKIPPMR